MRSPFYWLSRSNREQYATSLLISQRAATLAEVRSKLHHAGLLTPQIDDALNAVAVTRPRSLSTSTTRVSQRDMEKLIRNMKAVVRPGDPLR